MNKLENLLYSPANWCGLGLATLALVPLAVGIPLWGGWMLAPIGYVTQDVVAVLEDRRREFDRIALRHLDGIASAVHPRTDVLDLNPGWRLSSGGWGHVSET